MKSLKDQFPLATKRVKNTPVDHGKDNPGFTKRFFREVGSIILVVGGFTMGVIVLLFLIGALKLLGVKEL